MYLQFKKLNDLASVPTYANEGDAGLDLIATSVSDSDSYQEYGTGLAAQIPHGFVGLLFPRSSISKTRHILRNSVGVIDSSYRGEIKIRMGQISSEKELLTYSVGDKIAQLIIMEIPKLKVVEVEQLEETQRGQGGFGSSGR